jgi:hypothetical protein
MTAMADLAAFGAELEAKHPGLTMTTRVVPRPADYDPERPITVEIEGAWGIDYMKVSAATAADAASMAIAAIRQAREGG